MRIAFRSCCVFLGISALASGLIGCNLSQFSAPSTASSVLPAISGTVHGGQQPISGASIQIYAANTSVSKGGSTALLGSPVLTNASGGFSIGAGAYTCPTPGTLVYLVATGGNPGLPGNVNNAAIALMVVLGTCSSLSTDAFVTVNELTTVASVEALAPFMADAAHVGSDAGNPGGLAGAFATAASMVNFATGQLQPAASGVTQPTALLNTLADILAACVNSPGRGLVISTPCGVLYGYAGLGGSPDTLTAMLQIVQYPASNVAQLFGLVGASVPFAPALTSAPTDFTFSIAFPLSISGNYLLAIDTAQHIWVYQQTPLSSQPYVGSITVFDNNGILLFTIQLGLGGLYLPIQIAADPFGNVWALNSNLTLSKYGPSGNSLSPSGGFPVPLIPPSNATPQQDFGGAVMSFDPSGNLWGINTGMTSNCFIEVSNAGAVITPAGNFCSAAGGSGTLWVTTDGSGNAWFQTLQSISKVNGSGMLAASGVNSNGCFDDVASGPNYDNTFNLLYDRVNDQLWGTAAISVGALRPDGKQVFCDSLGENLPVVLYYDTYPGYYASPTTQYYSGELSITNSAVDGNGNLWFATAGFSETFTFNSSSTITFGGLNALNPAGGLMTPYNAAHGVYGLSGAFGGGVVPGNLGLMAIDAYGNIWAIVYNLTPNPTSPGSYSLVKIPGLAAPRTY